MVSLLQAPSQDQYLTLTADTSLLSSNRSDSISTVDQGFDQTEIIEPSLTDDVFADLSAKETSETSSDLESLSSDDCLTKLSTDLDSFRAGLPTKLIREYSVADSGLQSESDSSSSCDSNRALSREDSTISSIHSVEDSSTLSPDSPDSGTSRSPRWVRLSVSLFSQHVDVLETQMFATFIDNKIMSQWQDPDKSVKVFDLRNNVKVEGEGEEDHQKATYERFKGLAQVGKWNW